MLLILELSRICQYDFESLGYIDLFPSPTHNSGISASTSEYLASLPSLSIDTVYLNHPSCAEEYSGGFTLKHRHMRGRGLKYELVGHYTQTDSIFTGLAEGDYLVNMIDTIWGCDFLSDTIRLVAGDTPPLAEVEVSDAFCDSDNGEIVIAGQGYDFNVSLDGGVFSSDTSFYNLKDGNHQLILKYNEQCIDTIELDISRIASPTISFEEIEDHCGQGLGSLKINNYEGVNPLEWKLGTQSYGQDTIFEDLLFGDYDLTIRDSLGCEIVFLVQIANIAEPEIEGVGLQLAGCTVADGSLLITASGFSVLEYSLNGISWQSDSLFNNLASGDFTIYVRDSSGCEASENATIDTKDDPVIADFEIEEAGCTVANGSLLISATGTSVFRIQFRCGDLADRLLIQQSRFGGLYDIRTG